MPWQAFFVPHGRWQVPPTVGRGLECFFLGSDKCFEKKQLHQSSDIFAAHFHLVIGVGKFKKSLHPVDGRMKSTFNGSGQIIATSQDLTPKGR